MDCLKNFGPKGVHQNNCGMKYCSSCEEHALLGHQWHKMAPVKIRSADLSLLAKLLKAAKWEDVGEEDNEDQEMAELAAWDIGKLLFLVLFSDKLRKFRNTRVG